MSVPGLRHVVPAVALGSMLVAGCGESYDKLPSDAPTPMHFPTPTLATSAPSTPGDLPGSTPTAAAGATPCSKQLTRAAAERLAGVPVHGPQELPVNGLMSCRWKGVSGGVQVVTMEGTMDDWEGLMPPELISAARRIMQMSGDDCELFKAMTGAARGSTSPGPDHLVAYLPDRGSPKSLEAQRCRHGRFGMVDFSRPGLRPDTALEQRAQEALASFVG